MPTSKETMDELLGLIRKDTGLNVTLNEADNGSYFEVPIPGRPASARFGIEVVSDGSKNTLRFGGVTLGSVGDENIAAITTSRARLTPRAAVSFVIKEAVKGSPSPHDFGVRVRDLLSGYSGSIESRWENMSPIQQSKAMNTVVLINDSGLGDKQWSAAIDAFALENRASVGVKQSENSQGYAVRMTMLDQHLQVLNNAGINVHMQNGQVISGQSSDKSAKLLRRAERDRVTLNQLPVHEFDGIRYQTLNVNVTDRMDAVAGQAIGSPQMMGAFGYTSPRRKSSLVSPELFTENTQIAIPRGTQFSASSPVALGSIGDTKFSIPFSGYQGARVEDRFIAIGRGQNVAEALTRYLGKEYAADIMRGFSGAYPQDAQSKISEQRVREAFGKKVNAGWTPESGVNPFNVLTSRGSQFEIGGNVSFRSNVGSVKSDFIKVQLASGETNIPGFGFEHGRGDAKDKVAYGARIALGILSQDDASPFAPLRQGVSSFIEGNRGKAEYRTKAELYHAAFASVQPQLSSIHEQAGYFPLATEGFVTEFKGKQVMTMTEIDAIARQNPQVAEMLRSRSMATMRGRQAYGLFGAATGRIDHNLNTPLFIESGTLSEQYGKAQDLLHSMHIGDDSIVGVGGQAIPSMTFIQNQKSDYVTRLWLRALTSESGADAGQKLMQVLAPQVNSKQFKKELTHVAGMGGSDRYAGYVPRPGEKDYMIKVGREFIVNQARQMGIHIRTNDDFRDFMKEHGKNLIYETTRFPEMGGDPVYVRAQYDKNIKGGKFQVPMHFGVYWMGDFDADLANFNSLLVKNGEKWEAMPGAEGLLKGQRGSIERTYERLLSLGGIDAAEKHHKAMADTFKQLGINRKVTVRDMVYGVQANGQYVAGYNPQEQNILVKEFSENFAKDAANPILFRKDTSQSFLSEVAGAKNKSYAASEMVGARLNERGAKMEAGIYNLLSPLRDITLEQSDAANRLWGKKYGKVNLPHVIGMSIMNPYIGPIDMERLNPNMSEFYQFYNSGTSKSLKARGGSAIADFFVGALNSPGMQPEAIALALGENDEKREQIYNYSVEYRKALERHGGDSEKAASTMEASGHGRPSGFLTNRVGPSITGDSPVAALLRANAKLGDIATSKKKSVLTATDRQLLDQVENGEIVVLDTETSGVDVGSRRLVEIAAKRIKDGKVAGEFSTLVKGRVGGTEIHGITQEMVDAGGMDEKKALQELFEFIGKAGVVGHNVGFDTGTLRERAKVHGVEVPDMQTYNTQTIAERVKPGQDSYKLVNLAKQLGVDVKDAHRAMGDVNMTLGLLGKLVKEMRQHTGIDITDLDPNDPETKRVLALARVRLNRASPELFAMAQTTLDSRFENGGNRLVMTSEQGKEPWKPDLAPLSPDDQKRLDASYDKTRFRASEFGMILNSYGSAPYRMGAAGSFVSKMLSGGRDVFRAHGEQLTRGGEFEEDMARLGTVKDRELGEHLGAKLGKRTFRVVIGGREISFSPDFVHYDKDNDIVTIVDTKHSSAANNPLGLIRAKSKRDAIYGQQVGAYGGLFQMMFEGTHSAENRELLRSTMGNEMADAIEQAAVAGRVNTAVIAGRGTKQDNWANLDTEYIPVETYTPKDVEKLVGDMEAALPEYIRFGSEEATGMANAALAALKANRFDFEYKNNTYSISDELRKVYTSDSADLKSLLGAISSGGVQLKDRKFTARKGAGGGEPTDYIRDVLDTLKEGFASLKKEFRDYSAGSYGPGRPAWARKADGSPGDFWMAMKDQSKSGGETPWSPVIPPNTPAGKKEIEGWQAFRDAQHGIATTAAQKISLSNRLGKFAAIADIMGDAETKAESYRMGDQLRSEARDMIMSKDLRHDPRANIARLKGTNKYSGETTENLDALSGALTKSTDTIVGWTKKLDESSKTAGEMKTMLEGVVKERNQLVSSTQMLRVDPALSGTSEVPEITKGVRSIDKSYATLLRKGTTGYEKARAAGLSEEEIASFNSRLGGASGGGGGGGGGSGSGADGSGAVNRLMSGYFAFQTLRAIRYTINPVLESSRQYGAMENAEQGILAPASLSQGRGAVTQNRIDNFNANLMVGRGVPASAIAGGVANMLGDGGQIGRGAPGTLYSMTSPAAGIGSISAIGLSQLRGMGGVPGFLGKHAMGLGLGLGALAFAGTGLAWMGGAGNDMESLGRGVMSGHGGAEGDITHNWEDWTADASLKFQRALLDEEQGKAPESAFKLAIAHLTNVKLTDTSRYLLNNAGPLRSMANGNPFVASTPIDIGQMINSEGVAGSTLKKLTEKYSLDEPTGRSIDAMTFAQGLDAPSGLKLNERFKSLAGFGLDPNKQLETAKKLAFARGDLSVRAGAQYLADGGLQGLALEQKMIYNEVGGGYGSAWAALQGGLVNSIDEGNALTEEMGSHTLAQGESWKSVTQYAKNYRNTFGGVLTNRQHVKMQNAQIELGRTGDDYNTLASAQAANAGIPTLPGTQMKVDALSNSDFTAEQWAKMTDEEQFKAAVGGDAGVARLRRAMGNENYDAQAAWQSRSPYMRQNMATIASLPEPMLNAWSGLSAERQNQMLGSRRPVSNEELGAISFGADYRNRFGVSMSSGALNGLMRESQYYGRTGQDYQRIAGITVANQGRFGRKAEQAGIDQIMAMQMDQKTFAEFSDKQEGLFAVGGDAGVRRLEGAFGPNGAQTILQHLDVPYLKDNVNAVAQLPASTRRIMRQQLTTMQRSQMVASGVALEPEAISALGSMASYEQTFGMPAGNENSSEMFDRLKNLGYEGVTGDTLMQSAASRLNANRAYSLPDLRREYEKSSKMTIEERAAYNDESSFTDQLGGPANVQRLEGMIGKANVALMRTVSRPYDRQNAQTIANLPEAQRNYLATQPALATQMVFGNQPISEGQLAQTYAPQQYMEQFGAQMPSAVGPAMSVQVGYGSNFQTLASQSQNIAAAQGLISPEGQANIFQQIMGLAPDKRGALNNTASFENSVGGPRGMSRLTQIFGQDRMSSLSFWSRTNPNQQQNLGMLAQANPAMQQWFGGLSAGSQTQMLSNPQMQDFFNYAQTPLGMSTLNMGGANIGGGIMPVDPNTGFNAGERSLIGIVPSAMRSMAPTSAEVRSFFTGQAQQRQAITGITPQSMRPGGWLASPNTAWSGRVETAAQNGQWGLQMLSSDVAYEGQLASAGVSAASARENFNFYKEFSLPVEEIGDKFKAAAFFGGTVQTDWMKKGGLPAVNFGKGKYRWEQESMVAQRESARAQTSQSLTRMGWQLEDLGRAQGQDNTRTQWQRDDMGLQQQSTALNRQWQQVNYGYQLSDISRSRRQMREDFATNRATTQMQFGWQMEDLNEGIRRSSGFDRRKLIRQRDRETEMNNVNTQQQDKEKQRAEEQFKISEQRIKKEMEHVKQMQKIEDEQFKRQKDRLEIEKKWRDEDFAIKAGRIRQEMGWIEEAAARQEVMLKQREEQLAAEKSQYDYMAQFDEEVKRPAERDHAQRQFELALASAGIAADQARKQKDIKETIEAIATEQERVWTQYKTLAESTAFAFLASFARLARSMGINIPDPSGVSFNNTKKTSGPPPAKMEAAGGPVSAREPYLIGENGPEIFVPDVPGVIQPTNNVKGSGGDIRVSIDLPISIGSGKIEHIIKEIIVKDTRKSFRR